MERLEAVGAYPEDGSKQHELRKEEAAQPDEYEGMEEISRGTCLLVTLEQKEQGYQEGCRRQVSRIQNVYAGADGYQQEVDGGLHRRPHADDGKCVVQLYKEVPDDAVQHETANAAGPGGDAEVAERFP